METLTEEVDAETKSLAKSCHASVPKIVNLVPQDNPKIKLSCQLCPKTFKYRYFIRDVDSPFLILLMIVFF